MMAENSCRSHEPLKTSTQTFFLMGGGQDTPSFLNNKERDQACWTNRGATYTQLSRPRTLQHGGNKGKTRVFFSSLTSTTANLSSSSPDSGMGSFRGMLCPLISACWSMLPAFPMFASSLTTNYNFFFSFYLHQPRPLEKIHRKRKEKKISARSLVLLSRPQTGLLTDPWSLFKIKHM